MARAGVGSMRADRRGAVTAGHGDIARETEVRSSRWYDGLPPVTGAITCGGQQHHITWRRGKLVLEDHDLLAERSLTALGSESPLCVEILEAWRRRRGIELLYKVLLRDDTEPPPEAATFYGTMRAVLVRPHSSGGRMSPRMRAALQAMKADLEGERQMWDITLIQTLPPVLRRMLALSELVSLGRRWRDERYRRRHLKHVTPVVTPITHPLFAQSVRRWRRNLKPHATFTTELRLVGPGEPPTCEGWVDSGGAFAILSLPTSWFADVWARGIALVDGCFVLSRGDGSCDGSSFPVVAVRWQRQPGGISGARAAPAVVSTTPAGERSLHWV